MRKELLSHITFQAELDDRIWLLTGDLGRGVVDEFQEKFPDRFINCGVAEQNMMGVAAGLARCGKIPFVYSMANFVTMRCLEQIRNDVSYPILPVRIISVGGGYTYGSAGYSHHGIEDISAVRSMPYMSIWVPTTSDDCFDIAFKSTEANYPMYIRVPRETYAHDELCGQYEDYDVILLTYGDGYGVSQRVARELEAKGLTVGVETAKAVRPFTRRNLFESEVPLVVIEEHSEFGGLASEYLDLMSYKGGRCLVYGISPQHGAGSCKEMLDTMFNVPEMADDISEWVSMYDNGR